MLSNSTRNFVTHNIDAIGRLDRGSCGAGNIAVPLLVSSPQSCVSAFHWMKTGTSKLILHANVDLHFGDRFCREVLQVEDRSTSSPQWTALIVGQILSRNSIGHHAGPARSRGSVPCASSHWLDRPCGGSGPPPLGGARKDHARPRARSPVAERLHRRRLWLTKRMSATVAGDFADLAEHFAGSSRRPTRALSSRMRISGSRCAATEKARRNFMPLDSA